MHPAKPNFKQRLIDKTGIGAEAFNRFVLRNTLPIHAKLLLPVARLFSTDVLAADYDLIAEIAMLTSRREFSEYVSCRRYHPANRGGFRKVLRVRVSIARLHRLVYDVMRPDAESASRRPFPEGRSDVRPDVHDPVAGAPPSSVQT